MALEPKRFYRKLEGILHEIVEGEPDLPWFWRIVREIVEHFGEELHVESGRLYTETPEGFRLDRDIHSRDPNVGGLVVRRGYRPLELVLDHGVYLFDEHTEGQEAALEDRLGGFESAAVLVDGPPRRILAFGLQQGWAREHLDFALNTIRNAINQRLRTESLEIDVAQAAEIQRSLLPRKVPEVQGYSLAVRSVAAAKVGGDFYDFLPQDGGLIYLALGDVSGHGLASALLARDVVTGLRMGVDRELKIPSIISRLNRVIARSILSTRFVSLVLAELETNGDLFYVNAGHLAPWIFGERGIRRLSVGGLVLGPVADTSFRRGFAHVDRGDTLVVVSDGLTERLGRDDSEFGESGLESVVAPLAGRPAGEVLKALFAASEKHGDRRSWTDDATALVVTRDSGAHSPDRRPERGSSGSARKGRP